MFSLVPEFTEGQPFSPHSRDGHPGSWLHIGVPQAGKSAYKVTGFGHKSPFWSALPLFLSRDLIPLLKQINSLVILLLTWFDQLFALSFSYLTPKMNFICDRARNQSSLKTVLAFTLSYWDLILEPSLPGMIRMSICLGVLVTRQSHNAICHWG